MYKFHKFGKRMWRLRGGKKLLWGWGPHPLDLWGLRWRSSIFFLWGMRWGPQPNLRGVRCLEISRNYFKNQFRVSTREDTENLGRHDYQKYISKEKDIMPFVQVRKYTFPTWGKYGKLRYEILSRALTQYQGYGCA